MAWCDPLKSVILEMVPPWRSNFNRRKDSKPALFQPAWTIGSNDSASDGGQRHRPMNPKKHAVHAFAVRNQGTVAVRQPHPQRKPVPCAITSSRG